jgi:hypothetical protein
LWTQSISRTTLVDAIMATRIKQLLARGAAMTRLYQSHYVKCPYLEDEKEEPALSSVTWCSTECKFYKSHNGHSLECLYPENQRGKS